MEACGLGNSPAERLPRFYKACAATKPQYVRVNEKRRLENRREDILGHVAKSTLQPDRMDDAELIYAFGFNAFSQIYSKKACIVNEPVQIEQKDVSTIIGASWATSFARTPDEAIYCWGWLEPGVESKPTQLYVSQFGEATTWTSTRTGDRLIAYSLTAKKLFSMASIRKNADGRCSAATVEETCLSTGVASISCTETDAWICSGKT